MRGFAFVLLLSAIAPVVAQEKSVRPGINEPFERPMPEEFVERFEREGRDAFDHRHAVVEACRLKPGMVVADIGAGTGLFTRLFAPHVAPGGKVYAVDIAEEFVKHAVRSAQAAGMQNVEGVVCTADSVNLPPQSIDLAFICDTYHHFEFPHKTMRSLHAALKPDGAVILIDFHRIEGVSSPWILSHVRAGQEVFSKEIVAAGFRQVEERKNLLQESYFVRFEKVQRAAPDKPRVPLPEKVSEPCHNCSSPESVELGKQRFFEFRLSSDNTMSCAKPHLPEKASGDRLPRGHGPTGKTLSCNMPSLVFAETPLSVAFFVESRTGSVSNVIPPKLPQHLLPPRLSLTRQFP